MRCSPQKLLLLAACALVLAVPAQAHEADVPVAGTAIKLQTDGSKKARRVRISARGREIHTEHDPRSASSWILVRGFGAGEGGTGRIELDPKSWKKWKNKKGDRGFRYRDSKGKRGGIEKVLLRDGKLSISAGGKRFAFAPEAPLDTLWVYFGVDEASVCAAFGGDVKKNSGGVFKAYKADAPSACLDAVCGNGIVEAGETCDDGNLDEEDGCTSGCDAGSCEGGESFASTFEAIQSEVFDAYGCTNGICHGVDPGAGGLNLLPELAHAELYGVDAQNSSYLRVDPGSAQSSALYLKLLKRIDADATDIPGFGMPSLGAALSAEHLEAVRLWIEADAPETGTVAEADELLGACTDSGDGSRTGLRRLTSLEYGYALQDLLQIDRNIAGALGDSLPVETDSGGFDTIAEKQGMSALHIRGYLDAADRALDSALRTGPAVEATTTVIDYGKSFYIGFMENLAALGGGIVEQIDDAGVQFSNGACSYTFHTSSEIPPRRITEPGRYRVSMEAYPYRQRDLISVTLFRGSEQQGAIASFEELLGAWELTELQTFEVETFLKPGDVIAPCVSNLSGVPGEIDIGAYFQADWFVADGYNGEGVAFKSLTFEGPLNDTWPPQSTRDLLVGIEFDEAGDPVLTKPPAEHVRDVVESFVPRAFRRPVDASDIDAIAALAQPLLDDGRPFLEAVRVPLLATLSAPEFLYHASPPGRLDDHALATRLAYFLWRTTPDAELLELADRGRLGKAKVLAAQVERLLDDPRSRRFIDDFTGQAYRLYDTNLTTPNAAIYPYFSEFILRAMPEETRLFFKRLVDKDLAVSNLIDSNWTYLNRPLAEHYGIPGISGFELKKVRLPADSPRGGILGHAAIHKITANGTSTSPVPRGNFVLEHLLGTPTPPPPDGIPSLEPDTRGTTTIREQLDAHRTEAICESCHRLIDPPGFALESFDPVGSYRTKYQPGNRDVDPSGVTSDGKAFADLEEYKQILLEDELKQVARNLVSMLLVFGTGVEIEPDDEAEIESIVKAQRKAGYPVRTLIHEVVASDLFRSR